MIVGPNVVYVLGQAVAMVSSSETDCLEYSGERPDYSAKVVRSFSPGRPEPGSTLPRVPYVQCHTPMTAWPPNLAGVG
jgi:hypothetical protein